MMAAVFRRFFGDTLKILETSFSTTPYRIYILWVVVDISDGLGKSEIES